MLKIYLDVCCLNRPFDSWEQDRVRLEGEVILNILERVNKGELELISSEAILVELEKMTNLSKKENIVKALSASNLVVAINNEIELRSQQLEELGFGMFDSYHLACAENIQADIFLSTDDRLLKNARRNRDKLNIEASNPVVWWINNLKS